MTEMTVKEAVKLLETSRIGRLAMADGEGRPYAIPLPFCWAEGAIYLRLPMKGRKGEVLTQNDRVCFEVDTYSDTLDDYASVLVEGRLVAVGDTTEKSRVQRINEEKYRQLRQGYRPGHGRSRPVKELPLRKIAVEQMTGRKKEMTTPTMNGDKQP